MGLKEESVRLVLLVLLLLLAGCSSIYHKRQGWVPEGYADKRLSGTEYQVSFQSYRGEDWSELRHLMIYRAAQIGKAQKFAYFSLKHIEKNEHYDEQTQRLGGRRCRRWGQVSPVIPFPLERGPR